MAKGNKQGEKGPAKKIQKNQKKKSKNQEKQFKKNDNPGNLESSQTLSFRQQGAINAMNMLEKFKKQENSSDKLILKNYNDVFSQSILQIIMTLYSGLEPTQILEFIDFQEERFLEILLLMLEDELPMISPEINRVNDQNSFINQEIPRSFSFGIKKLREKRKIADPCIHFILDEIDIKCLYVSHLLLIGVGEINAKIKSKEKGETTEHHFHRLVTHLLERNKLLTPKLFYLLEKKWGKIMEIVVNQIEQDQKERLAQGFQEQEKKKKGISRPINETERRRDMQTEEKRQKKVVVKQITNEAQNKMGPQDSQMMGLGDEEYSFEHRDLTSNDHDISKYFISEKLNDRQTQEQRNQRVFGNAEEEMQQNEGRVQHQEDGTANFNDKEIRMRKQWDNFQADYIAKKRFNYEKFYTVKRNSKSKKIQKQSKKKSKNDEENNTITKIDGKINQQEISQQYVANNQQIEFDMQDEDMNLYGREGYFCENESMEEIYNQEYEEESSEIMPSETIQSSERVNMINEFQMMHLQSTQVPPTTEVSGQNETNPNRAVPHVQREIDYLVSMVLSTREVFIETLASHIYFELVVWNGRLFR